MLLLKFPVIFIFYRNRQMPRNFARQNCPLKYMSGKNFSSLHAGADFSGLFFRCTQLLTPPCSFLCPQQTLHNRKCSAHYIALLTYDTVIAVSRSTALVVTSRKKEVLHIIHALREVVFAKFGCQRKKRCLWHFKRVRLGKITEIKSDMHLSIP